MYETREERDALFSFTGKYTEVKLLNEEATGFGWAVLVQDNFENKRLKVVKLPNREAATRELLAEAEILSKIAQYLRHPNLIGLGSVDRYVIEWGGGKQERWFIVLQYGGENLRTRLGRLLLRARAGKGDEYVYRDGLALPVDDVLQIAIQVTDGLRALHDFEEAPGQHIVHRDIKPENILIDEHGTIRLTDFGISKVVERLTQSVSVAGTLPYLAPEYSRGRITAASDIYSLGIVLYEMATGRFPFARPDDRFYQMPEAPHVVNPAVPARLSDVIMRALWWDPHAGRGAEEAQRYARAAEMLQDLRRCYSTLHPVPPQFVRLSPPGPGVSLYRDNESQADVRIYLYETPSPGQCVTRLAALLNFEDPRLLAPRRTFESEGVVGVVVPPLGHVTGPGHTADGALPTTVPASQLGRGGADPSGMGLLQGEAVYPFVARLVTLCRQLERLHRRGVYHGFLTPYNVHWQKDGWVIDHAWLGQLVGLALAEGVLARTEVAAGFLAPEV
jgi:serine/threonine protein kinase